MTEIYAKSFRQKSSILFQSLLAENSVFFFFFSKALKNYTVCFSYVIYKLVIGIHTCLKLKKYKAESS